MAMSISNPKQQAWLDAMRADPTKNSSRAARAAGYAFPRVDGSRLMKRFRHLVEEQHAETVQLAGLKAETVLANIDSIATDTTHKDRLRALELQAKIVGLMTEKPQGDPKTLRQQVEELLRPPKPAHSTPQAESKRKTAKLTLVRSA